MSFNLHRIIDSDNSKASRTNKLILTERDIEFQEVWKDYQFYRSQLFKSHERSNCVVLQGSAFVLRGKAFLLMGVGGIDFLDSLGALDCVDGIIGNGNVIFISKDFNNIYSAHTTKELYQCYEIEGGRNNIKFLELTSIAPLIFILRSFKNSSDYEKVKSKIGTIIFEESNTFSGDVIRFAGPKKSRLRAKFIKTARVVHCARRPGIMKKEYLFDSYEDIKNTIDLFNGCFSLVYTLWDQKMCDAIGMRETRKLSNSYNPTDPITPFLAQIAMQFIERGNA